MLSMAQGPEHGDGTVPPIVALAASAGGIEALRRVLAALPAAFPAAVVIVQHMAPRQPSVMAAILGRHSTLPVAEAREGTRLTAGKIYVAPPDRHLLVGPEGILGLSDASPVHFVRPAADLLFTSLAESRGADAIAVVLTGSGFDGADGVVAIKRHGGTVIVQDQATSDFTGMPAAAFATGCADCVLPLEEIAPALIAMLRREEDA
jgi:two-component system chemotaxis response regulator CheB